LTKQTPTPTDPSVRRKLKCAIQMQEIIEHWHIYRRHMRYVEYVNPLLENEGNEDFANFMDLMRWNGGSKI